MISPVVLSLIRLIVDYRYCFSLYFTVYFVYCFFFMCGKKGFFESEGGDVVVCKMYL